MEAEKTIIKVETKINAPIEKVWEYWTEPSHIIRWNNASDDWHTPRAENDLRVGGGFLSRMESRDGSMGFDFSGKYTKVDKHERIAYAMDDGREVQIYFTSNGEETRVSEFFDAEQTNPIEMQKDGWQSIMDNFKKYVETSGVKEKLRYEISINADAEKVYKAMLEENSYKKWTSAFNPSSRYEGSWEKGSKIAFLGTDADGKTGGMISRIKENIPNEFLSIEHLGIIQNGKEVTTGPEVDEWAGATENYIFNEIRKKTLLAVEIDSTEQFKSYFNETWPKALKILKVMCEE